MVKKVPRSPTRSPPKRIGFLRIWRRIRDAIMLRTKSMDSTDELSDYSVRFNSAKGYSGVGKDKEEVKQFLIEASLLVREFNEEFSHLDNKGWIYY